MIDDVTFPSPSPSAASLRSLLPSLFLSLSRPLSILPSLPLREVVILRKLNIALKTHNPRSSLFHSFAYSQPLSSPPLCCFCLFLSSKPLRVSLYSLILCVYVYI